MSTSMLSIPAKPGCSSFTANLLPCRVQHDGEIEVDQAHWIPVKGEDGTLTSHFRGRKLQGSTIEVPTSHRGLLLDDSSKSALDPSLHDAAQGQGELSGGADKGAGTKEVKIVAEFQEMIVWGHESVVAPLSDPYSRGLGEWMNVSDKIHSFTQPETKDKKT